MKKLIAILTALLMLAMCAASAETVVIADPVVKVDTGSPMTLDLTGLELAVTAGEAGGVPAVQIDINGNGSKLMGAAVNVIGNKAVFAFDGGSNVYSVEIPAEALQTVNNLDLSKLNIDTDALMNTIMNGVELTDNSIKVPYTTINDVLEMLAPALSDVEIPGLDVNELISAVAQLKESNSGISLEGTYEQDGSDVSANVSAIPVQNGVAGEAAINVSVEMGDDGMGFSIEVPGQAELYFALSPADDNTVGIALGGNADGQSFDLTAVIKMVESDVTLTAIAGAENAIDVQTMTSEQSEALTNEFSKAASGLMGYLFSALGAAA